MKPIILSIGNATRDIFLDIDNQKTYKDEIDNFHYDLTFDDSTLNYKSQYGVYGGIFISENIFTSSHFKSFSTFNPRGLNYGNKLSKEQEEQILNRYIITHNTKSVILSSKPKDIQWQNPIFTPNIIYIAESNFSDNYWESFKKYLESNKNIDLVINSNILNNSSIRELLPRTNLIFIDYSKKILTDLIDYSSYKKTISSLVKLGVNSVVIKDKNYYITGNDNSIFKAKVEFKLNSFYQSTIFETMFTAEFFSTDNLKDSLEIASITAHKSGYNDILKPFFARQIANSKKNTSSIEIIKADINIKQKIKLVAKTLVKRPKGIFAADESGGNIHKKFTALNIEDIEENRRKYREMFFTTPDIENYLSGIILFEETLNQSSSTGESFVDLLKKRNILIGLKLDEGLQPISKDSEETITLGLDSLDSKLNKYAQKIDFAKWRVAFKINSENNTPSKMAIDSNCQILARYAKLCQSYGVVPIVEPEIVFDGSHSIKHCRLETAKVLKTLFEELKLFKVDLEATILKTNMVIAGKNYPVQSLSKEVASETVQVLKSTVPKELAGVVFLSGGQTPQQATDNLQEIINLGPFDWGVTYSFARALQEPSLNTWKGKDSNKKQAQLLFLERVAANSHALYKN